MRSFLFGLIACLLLSCCVRAEAPVQATTMPEIEASGAVLIERGTGRVLFAINQDKMLPMASTTKVMTALLALENLDPDEVIVAGENASGVPGTSIYLGVGERLTARELLLGLLLRSGNDAAVALAERISGSVDAFCQKMNARALELDADAYFVNPHGLDAPNHAASALGMARIANEAMDFPAFRALVTTPRAVLPWENSPYDRVLVNKNKLLSTYSGSTGVKTGFTTHAGRCLIFSAERDGMELLGVVLNCANWFNDAAALLDWGFDTHQMTTFMQSGECAARIPVDGGIAQSIKVVAPIALRAPLGIQEKAELIVETEEALDAPVALGTPVGRARVVVAGETIAQTVLVAEYDVEARNFWGALRRAARFFCPVA